MRALLGNVVEATGYAAGLVVKRLRTAGRWILGRWHGSEVFGFVLVVAGSGLILLMLAGLYSEAPR